MMNYHLYTCMIIIIKRKHGSIGFVLGFVVSSEFVVDEDYQLDCASHWGSRCYIAYCGLFRQL